MFYAYFMLIGSWEDGKKLKGRDFFLIKGRVTENKLFLGLVVEKYSQTILSTGS